MKIILLALANGFAGIFHAQGAADPQVDSRLTTYSRKCARIYTTDANKNTGNAVTTGNNGSQNQAVPAYSGVQEIYSSGN